MLPGQVVGRTEHDGLVDAAAPVKMVQTLAAPELIDLEVASVWRRQVMAEQLEARRADLAVADLLALPLATDPASTAAHTLLGAAGRT